MELHRATANAFVDYLISHGYPPESLAFEWGDKDHAVDISVLDLDTNTPVAIYGEYSRRSKNKR